MTDRFARKSLRKTQQARTLGRQVWIQAALETLASQGVAGVRVELLARDLAITKGSFYHHFRNRDDLHTAMLEHWRQRMVIEVISDLERITDPRERFRRLMRVPFDDGRAAVEVEFAVRLWARSDRRVQTALLEVDALRLKYLRRVITACGVSPARARSRAVLTLAFLREAPRTNEATLAQCEALLVSP